MVCCVNRKKNIHASLFTIFISGFVKWLVMWQRVGWFANGGIFPFSIDVFDYPRLFGNKVTCWEQEVNICNVVLANVLCK